MDRHGAPCSDLSRPNPRTTPSHVADLPPLRRRQPAAGEVLPEMRHPAGGAGALARGRRPRGATAQTPPPQGSRTMGRRSRLGVGAGDGRSACALAPALGRTCGALDRRSRGTRHRWHPVVEGADQAAGTRSWRKHRCRDAPARRFCAAPFSGKRHDRCRSGTRFSGRRPCRRRGCIGRIEYARSRSTRCSAPSRRAARCDGTRTSGIQAQPPRTGAASRRPGGRPSQRAADASGSLASPTGSVRRALR